MPTLDRDGDVFILNLGDDENRFNPEWMTAAGVRANGALHSRHRSI